MWQLDAWHGWEERQRPPGFFDPGFDVCKMGERLVRPGTAPGAFAPGAFAAEARRAEAKGKPVPRSPQAAGGR